MTRVQAAFFALLAMSMALSEPAAARAESVVYSFANPPDAYGPKCDLVFDGAGNMYGTTFSGGTNNLGAVFAIASNGSERVLYSFAGGKDGSHPVAGLMWDAPSGNLVGTTVFGGAANNGTVFTVSPGGSERVLYSFLGGIDGANPYAGVVKSGSAIFGTTYNGGMYGYGTVFKLSAAGHESVLHSFNSAFPTLDGSYPYAGLVLHGGVLFGTTTLGGASNFGTVYSISTGGAYSLLYGFKGGAHDGQSPYAGVVFGHNGKLYGTTYLGGFANAGTVFVIDGNGKETLIHHFYRNSADGSNPYAGMIRVGADLYGTTYRGGSPKGGTVFRITLAGVETVLHDFTGGADGAFPYAGLLSGPNNTLFGTTLHGGTSNLGTVFKMVP